MDNWNLKKKMFRVKSVWQGTITFWAFETASRVLSLRRTSVRIAEIAQVFTKVSYNARLVVHNGIFLFVRSVLTVRVMYWARVEDYFYPFHEVCMHLLWAAEAASQSSLKIIVKREFGMLLNDCRFEI